MNFLLILLHVFVVFVIAPVLFFNVNMFKEILDKRFHVVCFMVYLTIAFVVGWFFGFFNAPLVYWSRVTMTTEVNDVAWLLVSLSPIILGTIFGFFMSWYYYYKLFIFDK